MGTAVFVWNHERETSLTESLTGILHFKHSLKKIPQTVFQTRTADAITRHL
jgi:hypothetical protein